jgi:HTH-type transcriptional regulator, fmd operon transcriptional regulator
MKRKRLGFLTDIQIEVLAKRSKGMNQGAIAKKLGTTKQNISTIERRAKRNLRLAIETVDLYDRLTAAGSLVLEPGTFKIDIPRLVVNAADKAGVKVNADFTRIYNEIKFKASDCVDGKVVVNPITVLIMKDGDFRIVTENRPKTDGRKV